MEGSWVCYRQLGVWCNINILWLDSSSRPPVFALTDVRARCWLTYQKWRVERLPSYQLDGWTTRSMLGSGVPFDACSALPLLRTSHLQSVQWTVNRNANLLCIHILSVQAMCFSRQVRSLFIFIAVQWAYRYRWRHANWCIVFTNTAMPWVFTHWCPVLKWFVVSTCFVNSNFRDWRTRANEWEEKEADVFERLWKRGHTQAWWVSWKLHVVV